MTKKIRFSSQALKEVLYKYQYNLNTGDIVTGNVFHEEKQGFLVDIGNKTAGYLPKKEVAFGNNLVHKIKDLFLVNQTREFFIIAKTNKSSQLLLSIKRLEYIRGWKRIKQLEKDDIIIHANIKKINRGGLLVEVEGIIGFIPSSHVVDTYNPNINKKRIIRCQLLLANEKHNKLILSEKRALLALNIKKFKIGDYIDGKIIDIKHYGLFVKIHNIHALLHISEIGDEHIQNIYKYFNIGDKIRVQIRHIDMKQGRISVSTRK
uniref:30S ribosomal protein S1 n=1 Tax=Gastroclonium compressum TaxID=1852973 RepID=A0A173G0A8_GASCM|nr:30S ribosomal protein S1 [Coeloseira compressa]ANH09708.1 30S ribosomal protein S1 [Coeloseira compressa]